MLCISAILSLTVNAEIIERAYNSTEEADLGTDDILIIKGTGGDIQFTYNNYSGSGVVYYYPDNYSYLQNYTVPDGYTNNKIFIVGNALGLHSNGNSSEFYGTNRILVLTNELPTSSGTSIVNEGTLFNHGDIPNTDYTSPTYDNNIQIKGVGGMRVGWLDTALKVTGKISDYTDASGNVTPGNSVGDLTVYGDVTIDAGATGLFEFSAYNEDPALQSFDKLTIADNGSFIIDANSIIKLFFENNEDANLWAAEGAEYKLVSDEGFANGNYDSLLADDFGGIFSLQGKYGNGLYLIGLGVGPIPPGPGPDPGSGVPEPSTWALLILGAMGLLYMRKRK